MKLDNKGFAISGILYAIMILFLTIIFSLLALVTNRKLVLDKYKGEVKELINNSEETFGIRVQLANNTSNFKISENAFADYDPKSDVAACLNASITGDTNPLCRSYEVDYSDYLAYRIYDTDGNEVTFNFNTITSSDSYSIKVASYTYYARNNSGTYLVNNNNTGLKTVTNLLDVNNENKFYIKYSAVDNNNILSKEVTRTLVINKYNYYINITDNYYSIDPSDITSFDFKTKAKCYNYDGTNLNAANSSLNYALYDSNNELITGFSATSTGASYTVASGTKTVNPADLFHVRYYVDTLADSKAEIRTAYFSVN